ncbi:MAG: Do family serine endopeptidase [Ancalomicrobiaceae bacterium]|nr:Do family serine endopeptidase [Ancalomicrobiaceae bacterium]
MSNPNPNNRLLFRQRMLASVAILALCSAGVVGAITMSASGPARAAAVDTTDLQTQPAPSFAKLIDRVKGAVVSVKVKVENASGQTEDLSGSMENLPPQVQQFFKQFRNQFGAEGNRQMMHPVTALGSGFFVSADGLVVTNNHVVENAKTMTVTMDDGKTLDATVVSTDPKTDLAVLKVTEKGDYPFVSFAKEAAKPGDWVVAIGNPYGLGGTVTAGIVSAIGRDIGSGPYDNYLQIDAPINKGNSGGPTFNLKGEVVGVNTAIYSPSGGSVGIGFDIPSSTAETVISSLETGGKVVRGYLGVRIQPVTSEIADSLGMKTAAGALIDQAMPGTPAAKAGLKAGDVITALNGQPIKDARELTRLVGALKPGDDAKLTFVRGGNEQTADVSLATQTNDVQAKAETKQHDGIPVLGVELAPAKQIAGAGSDGVAIVSVNPNSAAADAGLKSGDVILSVADKPVEQPAEVKAAIAAAHQDGKKAVLLRVKSAEGSHFVAFELPKA